ncbi:hypothetical protein AMELA_G00202150 [Ameiurus melas]|uniref:Uncharacterized protein n=1 Tax=Ameiurus melas TaxID=219545 RepID=A0A7J6A658_AMEME|nr:hypothetical protein AMELA_G00202150 [Ameiurus melas]
MKQDHSGLACRTVTLNESHSCSRKCRTRFRKLDLTSLVNFNEADEYVRTKGTTVPSVWVPLVSPVPGGACRLNLRSCDLTNPE